MRKVLVFGVIRVVRRLRAGEIVYLTHVHEAPLPCQLLSLAHQAVKQRQEMLGGVFRMWLLIEQGIRQKVRGGEPIFRGMEYPNQ
jgi:hypothetical protein